jgi:hypothetical protein
VLGSYSKRSCAAQATLRSDKGQRVGFSVYWVPGRALHLLTTHPGYSSVDGKQQVRFRFPDGKAMTFAMKRSGNSLQTNIGFGLQAKAFYRQIDSNPGLRIEIPVVGDAVDVDLGRRREVEAAMRHCRDWLKS